MTTPSPTRRVIQIATWGRIAYDRDGLEHKSDGLYALCDDGTMWYLEDAEIIWCSIPSIPQPIANKMEVPCG